MREKIIQVHVAAALQHAAHEVESLRDQDDRQRAAGDQAGDPAGEDYRDSTWKLIFHAASAAEMPMAAASVLEPVYRGVDVAAGVVFDRHPQAVRALDIFLGFRGQDLRIVPAFPEAAAARLAGIIGRQYLLDVAVILPG